MIDGFQLIRRGVAGTLDCSCELMFGLDNPVHGCKCWHLDCVVFELPRVGQSDCSHFCQRLDDSVVQEGGGEIMCFHVVVIPRVMSNLFEIHQYFGSN